MNALEIDFNTIIQIINYCVKINRSIKRFGNSCSIFKNDEDYKDSVSMNILQIGELSARLSEDFKLKYNGVPWHQIKGMRNIAAHEYYRIELDTLWVIITERIPELCRYCEKVLRENNIEEYSV